MDENFYFMTVGEMKQYDKKALKTRKDKYNDLEDSLKGLKHPKNLCCGKKWWTSRIKGYELLRKIVTSQARRIAGDYAAVLLILTIILSVYRIRGFFFKSMQRGIRTALHEEAF